MACHLRVAERGLTIFFMRLPRLPSFRVGFVVLALLGGSASASAGTDECKMASDSGCGGRSGGPHASRADYADRSTVEGFLRDAPSPDGGQPISFRQGYGASFKVSTLGKDCQIHATIPGMPDATVVLAPPSTPGTYALVDVGATASFNAAGGADDNHDGLVDSRVFPLTGTLVVREAPQPGVGQSVQGAWSFHLTTSQDSAVQADLDVVALSTYRACVDYY